ncbi:MAG TPA: metalloregulator ArsR/SmtB family transcription factor [Gemmataceae bacterium]|nr:metalloregulator ArsR/SmtB family transcription factor [Gemmataceae bacterium]
MQDELQSTECARRLKALADPERLKIIQCLTDGPKNVTTLSDLLGSEIANVSHHLGVLRHAGLVRDEKQGKFVVYSLHPDVFRPRESGQPTDVIDLGCCRLELGG